MGQSDLTLYFDSFEYRIDGKWEIDGHRYPSFLRPNPEPVPGTRLGNRLFQIELLFFDEIHELINLLPVFLRFSHRKSGWILQRLKTQAIAAAENMRIWFSMIMRF
jgi:hypothetical protein